MNKEELDAYAKDYKSRHGIDITVPCRIQYRWMSTEAEGDLWPNGTIHGFPGMTHILDKDVSQVKIDKDIAHEGKYISKEDPVV